MRKLLAIVLVLCIVMGTMSGCGARDDSSEEIEFEQLEWPVYNNAKQIPVPKSSMADIQNKNDVRFSFYLANTTFEDFTDYVAACKEKGFTVDPVEQENRFYAFNNDRYELTVEYHEGDIMYVSVVEERFDVEIKLLHVNETSADMYDLTIEIDGGWEEDSERGDEAVSFDSYLKEGKHTLIVENSEDDDISGRIDFEIAADGEYLEFEINCLSNKIEISRINGTVSENSQKAQETDIAYPVNPDAYLSLSADDVDKELSIIKNMTAFKDKSKAEALAAYPELGDDDWSKLLMDGELFGITGQYAFVYSDDVISSFGFHWMMDDYDTHTNQMLHCLNTYFGNCTTSKEFYSGGTTYNQYKWTKTTEEQWFVHLSLQDSNSGWLEITPATAVTAKESFIECGLFSIAASRFEERFEESFDGIEGYVFKLQKEEDGTKAATDADNFLYYRIIDANKNNRNVGMIDFTKPNGKALHYTEELSPNCWNGINLLIEKADDVSAVVLATVFAADPGAGYNEAFDIAQDIVDSVSVYTGDTDDLNIIEHNHISYILYTDNEYHYLLVSVSGSDNSSQSEESLYKNESAQKDSGSSNDGISLTQAKNVFDDVFSEYDQLVEDFSELLDYCNQTNFTSEDQIHEFEEQWADLANTANELAYKLETNTPPRECKAEWDAFAEKLKEIGTILYKGSVMDSNYDGSYTTSEMESVINTSCDDFVAVGEDIIEIARTFYDKIDGNIGNTQSSAPADTSTTKPTSSQSKKCEECGKSATKSVNLFGQTEYYCTTHYNEIMDIIDMMESDVGKGTASKHTCEECSSEGTHSIIGFSGKTEYYCTKHYNELQAMLEIFG